MAKPPGVNPTILALPADFEKDFNIDEQPLADI